MIMERNNYHIYNEKSIKIFLSGGKVFPDNNVMYKIIYNNNI